MSTSTCCNQPRHLQLVQKPDCQAQSTVKSRFNVHDPPTSQAQQGGARAGAEISGRGCQRLISTRGLAI